MVKARRKLVEEWELMTQYKAYLISVIAVAISLLAVVLAIVGYVQ